jgi:hypothetical protein
MHAKHDRTDGRERAELNQRAASCSGRADDARRARLILLLEAAERTR